MTASLILVPMPTCWPGAPVLPVFCIVHNGHQVRTEIRYGQSQAATTPTLRRHAKMYRADRSKLQGCIRVHRPDMLRCAQPFETRTKAGCHVSQNFAIPAVVLQHDKADVRESRGCGRNVSRRDVGRQVGLIPHSTAQWKTLSYSKCISRRRNLFRDGKRLSRPAARHISASVPHSTPGSRSCWR